MSDEKLLEVTITHNLDDPDEVKQLYEKKWIALNWGRIPLSDNGKPNPGAYEKGRAQVDVRLFIEMQEKGAAIIAAYRGADSNRAIRLIGLIEQGAKFQQLNGLLCLPLSNARRVDSSRSFLGNLVARQCTLQRCGNRARGRLAALVQDKELPRSVELLHHRDVEWLVTNYLISSGMCQSVWSGIQSFQDIDHAGWMKDGHELLAQTTVSQGLVKEKAEKLLQLKSQERTLHFFGPESAKEQCPDGIEYHSIENVFRELDKQDGGKWLINRMVPSLDFGQAM